MASITRDRFGNVHATFDGTETLDDVQEVMQQAPLGKAVLLKNLSTSFVSDNILYQGLLPDGTTVHLCRNASNCPELIDEKIFATGSVIIVKKGDCHYAILCRDMTKRVITSIGGVCERSDLIAANGSVDEMLSFRLSEEIAEETRGQTGVGDVIYDVEPLSLPTSDQFASLQFNSSYFGIEDIEDNYKLNGTYIENSEGISLFDHLFMSENKDMYGNFSLNYLDNNETEYIHAILLVDTSPDDIAVNMVKPVSIGVYDSIEDGKPFVSGIHLSVAYLYALHILFPEYDSADLRAVAIDKASRRAVLAFI